jgi:hypothetical protein
MAGCDGYANGSTATAGDFASPCSRLGRIIRDFCKIEDDASVEAVFAHGWGTRLPDPIPTAKRARLEAIAMPARGLLSTSTAPLLCQF